MRSPSLPNRTGGSPASGFPVSGCSFEEKRALRAVPKDAGQTFGSIQANCTRLVPPPVSPRGHSRWFVFRQSVLHPCTFLRSLRSTVVTRFVATTDALTPAVAALRPARGMNTVFGPPPVSLIISLGLPGIPSPTIDARPARFVVGTRHHLAVRCSAGAGGVGSFCENSHGASSDSAKALTYESWPTPGYSVYLGLPPAFRIAAIIVRA